MTGGELADVEYLRAKEEDDAQAEAEYYRLKKPRPPLAHFLRDRQRRKTKEST